MSNRDIAKLYGESVPRKKFDTISNRFSEAKVTISFDDDNVDDITLDNISDADARRLVTANDMSFKLPEVISRWVQSGGWSSEDAVFVSKYRIQEALVKYLNAEDKDILKEIINEIESLIKIKPTFTILSDVVNNNADVDNFYNIPASLGDQFTHLVNPDFIRAVSSITFTEGNVNVGQGEVFLTLYTEAINPDVGDLKLPDGTEIELKGENGRPLKGGGPGFNKIKEFEKYAITHLEENYESQMKEWVSQHAGDISNSINAIAQFYVSILNNPEFNSLHNSINGALSIIQQSARDILKPNAEYTSICNGLESIKKYHTTGANATKWRRETNELLQSDPGARQAIDYLLSVENYISTMLGYARGGKATKTVKAYFQAYDQSGISESNIDKFAEDLSIYSTQDSGQVQSVIKSAVQRHANEQPAQLALWIAATIQICNYALEVMGNEKEGFDYYMLFSPTSGAFLSIGPFTGNNYFERLNAGIDSLVQARPDISPDTGGRSGYNINIP